ncbi:hypothetical protein DOM22_05070 [Bdellovibrio sp. ZAP7]|uniref:universal stress protein n=1 Tax=Bdellovibrio sp. ZAP7 TaxID=2231053 RepID=UPI001156F282|nr:universal stress protein [Bdellovibrio sp. ZAP7]QDK44572.1 hypothetical protein DOM22_05070 [Bdellovibrio sp. ZAP7]
MENKVILAADDLSSRSKASNTRSDIIRDLSAEIARRLRLPLGIVYVSLSKQGEYSPQLIAQVKRQDREAIQKLKKQMSYYSVKTKVDTVLGDPVEMILKRADLKSTELLVIGAQWKRGIQKILIGSVSEEILRKASCPVLIVGPEVVRNDYEIPIEDPLRILMLTDLSPASTGAEDYANFLAKRMKADLTICYSWGHRMYELKEALASRKLSNLKLAIHSMNTRRRIEKLLNDKVKTAEKMGINVQGLLLSQQKSLERVIASDGDQMADLIVVGSHSRSRVTKAFIGSTTRKLILESPVPILVVRSNR